MIKLKNVYKYFSEACVVEDVSVSINNGEIFGIIGHSGAGKSTLLRCLNGLETYEKGSIQVMEREVNSLSKNELKLLQKEEGMIFQSFNLVNRLNVHENVALPLKCWKYPKHEINCKVNELLSLVGIEDKANCMPKELSGGQKQRVAIARALALNPKILLCDEATSALDPKTTQSILQLLKEINNKLNITIVIVTHQMEVIKHICNRVAVMKDGKIQHIGNVEELFLNPPEDIKDLLAYEDVLPPNGINIKIFFSKEISQNTIITSMARELDIDFSISFGKLEKFRDNVLGSLVINTSKDHKYKICDYLSKNNIVWEVL